MNWGVDNYYQNDWLSHNQREYTMTPKSDHNISVWNIENKRLYDVGHINEKRPTRPTLYLNSNVQITGGTGSTSDPFQLE